MTAIDQSRCRQAVIQELGIHACDMLDLAKVCMPIHPESPYLAARLAVQELLTDGKIERVECGAAERPGVVYRLPARTPMEPRT